MPRFFFHVEDGQSYPDLQGTELADMAAAKREALRFAGSLFADASETFWDPGEWMMRVTDEKDLTLFQLTLFATQAPIIKP